MQKRFRLSSSVNGQTLTRHSKKNRDLGTRFTGANLGLFACSIMDEVEFAAFMTMKMWLACIGKMYSCRIDASDFGNFIGCSQALK